MMRHAAFNLGLVKLVPIDDVCGAPSGPVAEDTAVIFLDAARAAFVAKRVGGDRADTGARGLVIPFNPRRTDAGANNHG